jgi:AcrR family transcriptional regulator
VGLRELKKRQTRERIAEAAQLLFAERGFDRVTVADVAREAQVAPATVFNYFPTKEELFFGPLEVFGERLVEAVRGRPAGRTVLAAFREHVEGTGGLLARIADGDADAAEQLRTMNRVIAQSPALLASERRTLALATAALADLIAAELQAEPDDIRPYAAANALMGVHRALLDHARRRALDGGGLSGLPVELRRLGRAGFALLERGLADYGPGPTE